MKKLIFATAIILLSGGMAPGQSLEKGNLIGTHILSIDLKPGITMNKG